MTPHIRRALRGILGLTLLLALALPGCALTTQRSVWQ